LNAVLAKGERFSPLPVSPAVRLRRVISPDLADTAEIFSRAGASAAGQAVTSVRGQCLSASTLYRSNQIGSGISEPIPLDGAGAGTLR
jgi:hypothetical protein